MFELILSLLFISLFVFFFVSNAKLKMNNRKLKTMIIQLEIDKKAIADKLSTLDIGNVAHEEGFVRFLTMSRDWAYTYIEDVQSAIKQFKDTAGPQIDHYKKYGDVMWTPLHDQFQKVTEAYDNLIKVLPEDEKDEVQA